MKHIKTFENISNQTIIDENLIKIGHYVIMNMDKDVVFKKDVKNFVKKNVGQIIDIKHYKTLPPDIIVKYDNMPSSLYSREIYNQIDNVLIFENIGDIVYISDDKEYLEALLNANKYNL